MATRRVQILEAVIERLRNISQANDGFETDAGESVYIGEKSELGPDDGQQQIALIVGDEDSGWQGAGLAFLLWLPISIRALAKADLEQPWLTVEALIGDIKRAVETGDPKLGGLLNSAIVRGPVVSLQREPGSTTVGAAVVYRLQWKEGFGNP